MGARRLFAPARLELSTSCTTTARLDSCSTTPRTPLSPVTTSKCKEARGLGRRRIVRAAALCTAAGLVVVLALRCTKLRQAMGIVRFEDVFTEVDRQLIHPPRSSVAILDQARHTREVPPGIFYYPRREGSYEWGGFYGTRTELRPGDEALCVGFPNENNRFDVLRCRYRLGRWSVERCEQGCWRDYLVWYHDGSEVGLVAPWVDRLGVNRQGTRGWLKPWRDPKAFTSLFYEPKRQLMLPPPESAAALDRAEATGEVAAGAMYLLPAEYSLPELRVLSPAYRPPADALCLGFPDEAGEFGSRHLLVARVRVGWFLVFLDFLGGGRVGSWHARVDRAAQAARPRVRIAHAGTVNYTCGTSWHTTVRSTRSCPTASRLSRTG